MASSEEYERYTPLTTRRRDYILGMLAERKRENWIRISQQEFSDFGGMAFFTGPDITVTRINDKWFTTSLSHGWDKAGVRVQLPIRVEVNGREGWTPAGSQYYESWYTTTTSTNSTITLTNTIVSGQPLKGKQVREHHIDRATLTGVVTENKERYVTAYARFKALYADEVEALTQKHLDGLIPTNQIVVKDKDGNAITILANMEPTFNDQLRELELDSREVVILDQEEYGLFVLGYATNLRQVEDTAKKLEELQ